MKTKILLLFLAIFQLGFSQERTCGTDEKMAELMFNPLRRQQHEQTQLLFEAELERLQSGMAFEEMSTEPFRIPVAVHFPNAGSANATVRNCLRNLAQNQINILNADYNGTNADLVNWINNDSFSFPGVTNGSLNVNLELATQNHPLGMGLTNGEVAVTFGYDFGQGSDWDPAWQGYLNIVVRNNLGTTLGYAYLGSNPASGAAIFMNNSAFGSVGNGCAGYMPSSPYNLGRTLTHELGHYFNLNHTFSSTCANSNCSNQGDRVCDTPPSDSPTFGCPGSGVTFKCETVTMTMNFMDYTNDACMYMFTEGQAQRQLAHFNVIKNNFNQATLSSSNFEKNDEVTLFPNPSKGLITMSFGDYAYGVSYQVIDFSGRVILNHTINESSVISHDIDLRNAAKGVYIISVKTDNGTVNRKVIID
ncbi:MAG: zinc-dependent metalloprotease [Flavobacterium sp.]|jgi:hypothetical protein|nr:zinc-dependent metalloprotease [Flavobacterium sp.]